MAPIPGAAQKDSRVMHFFGRALLPHRLYMSMSLLMKCGKCTVATVADAADSLFEASSRHVTFALCGYSQ